MLLAMGAAFSVACDADLTSQATCTVPPYRVEGPAPFSTPHLPPEGQECVSEGLEVCGTPLYAENPGPYPGTEWLRCENGVWTATESTASCDLSERCDYEIQLGDCCYPPHNCGFVQLDLYCDGYRWRQIE